MVDISHVTDDTFYQVMEISTAPAIASHSSCRKFTPGWERNIDDEMIALLAKNGGVVQINFGSSFLTEKAQKTSGAGWKAIGEFREKHGITDDDDPRLKEAAEKYKKEHPPIFADISDVVAHIDHVVEIAGIDYVGLGSDFDGVGDSLPTGLKDVSAYPNLIFELLKKGYSEEDVAKICGGNLLRVWKRVEEVAAKLQAAD
jgi:membrane dipeptidase